MIMLSLSKYQRLAELLLYQKRMSRFANNDDLIAHIVYNMAKADSNHDDVISNRTARIKKYGEYAISAWLRNRESVKLFDIGRRKRRSHKGTRKNPDYSLPRFTDPKNIQYIPYTRTGSVFSKEFSEHLLTLITAGEFELLKLHYAESVPYTHMSKILGLSASCIEYRVNQILAKLRCVPHENYL